MDTEGDQQDNGRASKARTPARVTATEKRRRKEAEAARLRAQGQSYADIAQAVGYRDPSSAHKAVSRALASSYREPTDAARLLAMNRLDGLRRALVTIATDQTVVTRDVLGALRLLLDVEKREAALLGLDLVTAPVVTSTVLDAEIDRLTREIGALDNLPVRDPWEDWTPADRAADDGHRNGQHHPGAEVVPFRTNGHDRGDRR